jgi:2-oxoglutarate ferredoxin oxidoreductase subunit alpha
MASQLTLKLAAIQSVNDFVVKFANVNGSGSASANSLFAKSILRMGIPASSRNIFPSNIQGLPTWYEVRISDSGHLGRRGGVDMMVAMNPETWDEDLAEIEPGGYLFYDSTKPLPPSKFRDDINVIGAPLTAICNSEYTDARQRQLFKNIIYLGALSALLDIDVAAIEKLIGEQFRGRDTLIKPNLHALKLGRDWALAEHECPRLHERQRRCCSRLRFWRSDRRRLVSDHPFLLACRGLCRALQPLSPRSRDQEKALCDYSG